MTPMKLTIDKKVCLFISILIFALGAILGFYFIRTQTRLLNRGLDELSAHFLADLATNLEYPLLVGDREAISREVKRILLQKDVVFCRVDEKRGLVYQEGRKEEGPVREFTVPIATSEEAGEAETLILDAPLDKTEKIGMIFLVVSLKDLNQKVSDTIRTVTTVVAVAIILAFLGVYGLLNRLVGAPVKQLVKATERIASGDLTHKVALKTKDEFEILGDSFDRMTESLQDAQAELLKREKLAILGQLAAGVGNELRNPLGVMNNAVFFLRDVLVYADDTVKEYLDIIKTEIDNSSRILSDFIDFFRSRRPNFEVVPIHGFIKQSIELCGIPDTVDVRLDLPEALPLVQVDPSQMRQVMQNLIANAVHAMPDGGALCVMARKRGRKKPVNLKGNPQRKLHIRSLGKRVGQREGLLPRFR